VTDAKELRKRLEALNRAPLRRAPAKSTEADAIRKDIRRRTKPSPPVRPIVYRRDLPEPGVRPLRQRPLPGKPVPLEEAVGGVVAESPHGAQAYVITRSILSAGGELSPLNAAFRDALTSSQSALPEWIAAACSAESIAPGDVVFFDLETTGLSCTPIFLVGAMGWEGDGLVARQFLARNYSEERAILSLFLEWAATKRLLVSFNGKSFDLPMVRVRAAANGIPFSLNVPHFDLLHVARRAWHSTLPNHRLQTLETHICGRARQGDIPSWEIPEAYHAYVRTANAAEIVEILRHNLLDLVTLADLMVRLPPPA